ncbi:short-chain dehydrogenase [Reticulibacter mediterranei]|uniref:Short-chain dehydrogenase n=1 Tax=Reticulibacter mediterranei TaxID=2778369 RepID=A0A8J3ITF9_9CHLR|nr:SDR family oxidoreductase [Reticulibacter mediterranei]GHO97579.1 short-chain dehydrogenase [Reticulibacter mediterranei]
MSTQQGKIALITGGSRGLGKEMAINIAAKGNDVLLTYNSKKEEAEAVVASIEKQGRKAVTLQLDVSDTKSFAAFAEAVKQTLKQKWNRNNFDFLVNNAGFGIYAPFVQTTEEQFDQVVNVQFKGTFFLTQTLLPLIVNGGRIINISTGLTRFSHPGNSAYGAAMGAKEVLTRYLAVELGERGIVVNTVAPGAIATDFEGGVVRDNKEVNQWVASQIALGRVGQPEDIGGAVAALLSEETRWVNGQRIEVSGGMNL